MNNKSSFQDKLIRFMYGRNGADALYRFLSIVCLALIIVCFILSLTLGSGHIVTIIFSVLVYALLAFSIFRVFSKNTYKRQAENRKYLDIKAKVKKWFNLQKRRWTDRKTSIYRKCPNCKNNLRLPRKKGAHTVNCPCCHNKFNINVWF